MKHRSVAGFAGYIFLLLFLLLTLTVNGQDINTLNSSSINNKSVTSGSSLSDRQIQYIRKDYSEKVEQPNELINGKEYLSYYIRSQSKPLLFMKKKRTAVLYTTSRTYKNLTLQYDTFLDDLIYTDTSRTLNYAYPQIALNKDFITGFTLCFEDDSMKFRYIRQPQCNAMNLKEGFYELAYRGKSEYVIRHASSYYMRDGINEYKYTPENYFRVGNTFARVTGKQSLLKLLKDKSAEVSKFIHNSHIHMNQAEKSDYISILKYYDSLKNAQ